jgi:pyruvate,water dikinase
VWVGNNAKDCWLVGAEAKKVKDIIFKKQKQKSRLLTGLPACPGFARGKARIILTAEKAKMQQGEILVVPMTRPEFVPLMKKASAVITNEGGLTCHAAIVSRELRIPCVVGTRIATKVLKDGDEVEVRAHRGEVRIL